jgi:hypothetical protein
MTVTCDKCDKEFDSAESMPWPGEDHGDLCMECLMDAEYDYHVKKGTEEIQKHLPSMVSFTKEYKKRHATSRLTTPLMRHVTEGNCHPAAVLLVDLLSGTKGLAIKLKRGHWLGKDARPSRRDFPAQQHSWTEVRLDSNPIVFLVDPTQFAFTGAKPGIAISTEDDDRYDPGSFKFHRIIHGPTQLPARFGKEIESGLSKELKKDFAAAYGDRDWRVWTEAEIFAIANDNPARFGSLAREVYSIIEVAGYGAFIPVDAFEEVMERKKKKIEYRMVV